MPKILCYAITFATMKNRPAKYAKTHVPPHKQKVLQNPNPKLCAVSALVRQIALLPPDHTPTSYLFPEVFRFSVKGHKGKDRRAAYGSIRGLVSWIRGIIKRPVTFKDCARRPAMTALTNALGAYNAAAVIGVKPRTVATYHRPGPRGSNLCPKCPGGDPTP